MGIPGLYTHIGKPERVALAKIASEHYSKYGRKLRVAIDASIWLFQVKSGRGGCNPEIRTLYYRLLRLLTLGIDPIFVFDGPGRPKEKRNKTTEVYRATPRAGLAKAMLDAFGFIYHQAPGEAEAECANLNTAKVVDAVLSEDVDTLMFGSSSTVLLRNWGSLSPGGKTSTHVDVFRASSIKANVGLDPEGLILFALMRGGDYDTAGIRGCGALIAYEAAKAGFGKDLCDLKPDDTKGFAEWRQRLEFELQTNESGYFKTRHPSLLIKDDFPNPKVFNDYRCPLVTLQPDLDVLRASLREARGPNVLALRSFVADNFAWDTLAGAKKMIRGLAPAMLTHLLLDKNPKPSGPDGLLSVCGNKTRAVSDGIPETRVELLPLTLVPLDLEQEPLHRPGDEEDVAMEDSESDVEELDAVPPSTPSRRERSTSPAKRRAPSKYNPNEPEKVYLADFYVRRGAPARVEAYEEALRAPKQPSPRKPKANKALAKTGMKEGAIEGFFRVKKPLASLPDAPPAKKARPVAAKRSKTDTDQPTQGDQQLTSLWGKTKGPTWAEKEYYASVEKQMKLSKAPILPVDLNAKPSTQRSILEHRLHSNLTAQDAAHTEPHDGFSSPISSQDLKEIAGTDVGSGGFSSPISSQDLLQSVEDPAKPVAAVKKADSEIRLRESLPGSFANVSPQGQRAGQRLRGVETIDLT